MLLWLEGSRLSLKRSEKYFFLIKSQYLPSKLENKEGIVVKAATRQNSKSIKMEGGQGSSIFPRF